MYKELFHNAYDAYLILDSDHYIVASNLSAHKLLKIQSLEGRKVHFSEFVSTDPVCSIMDFAASTNAWLPAQSTLIKTEETVDLHFRACHDQNSPPLIHVKLAKQAASRKAFKSLRDEVATTKNFAENEHRLRKQLEAAHAKLDLFAQRAAHDIRAPLRHILQGLQLYLMEKKEHPDVSDEWLIISHDSTKSLMRLVDDLLSYSEQIDRQARKAPTNLNELITAVLPLISIVKYQPEWLEVASLPEIMCDASITRIIFQNILGNALKYRNPTRDLKVSIYSREEDGHHIISIQDNGIGFDQKFATKLFEPFQRLDKNREGSGIGLATCKELATVQGWTIEAHGAPDKGARFDIFIPIHDEQESHTS